LLDLKAGLVGPASGGGGSVDLVIAGSGPAGLSAALYAARYRIGHVVLEGWQPGGQLALTDRIENYPGVPGATGASLVSAMRAQAVDAGARIEGAAVSAATVGDGRIEVATDSGVFSTRTLIVATGASPRKLGVPGEDSFYGRGVSYCATCDAPFFRGLRVAVVGGGDSAIKEALHLASFASEVLVIHRRDALRAEPVLAEKIMSHPGCRIAWSSRLLEIRGTGSVSSILLDTPGGQQEIPMDGVFIYVGRLAATAPFAGLITLREDGTVLAPDGIRTSRPDVFAAGDVTGGELRQVVTAAADGARAAAAAFDYLQHQA
jgi:thioredoxin reductase (NADPH)